MQNEIEIILNELKRRLKDQGVTYADLAEKLGTTEAAIKNIFHSKSISFDRLLVLTMETGLHLGELLQTVGLGIGGDFELTDENESIFLSDPGAYSFFRELVLHRKSVKKIAAQNQLDEKSVRQYLRQLEKMGLIEQSENGAIRLKVRGRHKWRVGGPWFQKNYLAVVNGQAKTFLRNPQATDQFLAFGAFSLSPEDLQRFQLEIRAVVDRFQNIALAKSLGQTEDERLRESFVGFNLLVSGSPHPGDGEKIPPRS